MNSLNIYLKDIAGKCSNSLRAGTDTQVITTNERGLKRNVVFVENEKFILFF